MQGLEHCQVRTCPGRIRSRVSDASRHKLLPVIYNEEAYQRSWGFLYYFFSILPTIYVYFYVYVYIWPIVHFKLFNNLLFLLMNKIFKNIYILLRITVLSKSL